MTTKMTPVSRARIFHDNGNDDDARIKGADFIFHVQEKGLPPRKVCQTGGREAQSMYTACAFCDMNDAVGTMRKNMTTTTTNVPRAQTLFLEQNVMANESNHDSPPRTTTTVTTNVPRAQSLFLEQTGPANESHSDSPMTTTSVPGRRIYFGGMLVEREKFHMHACNG